MLGFKRYIINYKIDDSENKFDLIRNDIIEEIENDKQLLKSISQINYCEDGEWSLAVELQAKSHCSDIAGNILYIIKQKLPQYYIVEPTVWKIEDEYVFNHLKPIVFDKILKLRKRK